MLIDIKKDYIIINLKDRYYENNKNENEKERKWPK